MSGSGRDYSWLPKHQFHVTSTLAHADDLIARASDVYFTYMAQGPLQLENVSEGGTCHTKVRTVAPLPAAIARYAADAFTQLRAAIEHTIYAEVEDQLGRDLTNDEGRQIEMPAHTTQSDFEQWLKKRQRRELAPLRDGTALIQRIRDLQPYQRQDPDQHPLCILAAHTNYAKHRAPAVAATGVGMVIPGFQSPEVELAKSETGGPARRGDILASAPIGHVVRLDIWPTVSIRRPHTGTWHVLIKELGALEEWVRTVAIPLLITGSLDVDALPPELDTTIGYDDVRPALTCAGQVPATRRLGRRFQAAVARQNILEMLEPFSSGPDTGALKAWVDKLTDDQLLERLDRLLRHRRDPVRLAAGARQLLSEAHRKAQAEG